MTVEPTPWRAPSSPTKFSIKLTLLSEEPLWQRLYALLAVIILTGTTLIWSLIGAAVQRSNADQLVNPLMLDGPGSLKQALFPGQHTYLLKWPIFWFVHLLHESTTSYALATVFVSLLTVFAFVYILWKIEPRPVYFGTLILGLASVLLLVPAQPYAGGLLPVSLAMVATRNIEYIFYILSLYLIVRAPKLKSKQFVWAVLLLALLIASDKLFLSLGLGGALIMLFIYGLRQKWQNVNLALRWFMATILAAAGALLALALISITKVAHIVGQGNAPYNITQSFNRLALGIGGAFWGLLTNFGANPAFDTIKTKSMPSVAGHHLFSLGGVALVLNLLLLVGAGLAVYQVFKLSFKTSRSKKDTTKNDKHFQVALLLIFSAVTAGLAYMATNHDYAVDARYVTISLFAGFMALAVILRTKQWSDSRLITTGLILSIGILMAIPMVAQTYGHERQALNPIDERNSLIMNALANHPVSTLIGDYWRVVPIKQLSAGKISVTPLSDCSNSRTILSNLSWQPDLNANSFAYLLSLDKGLTDFPRCNLNSAFSIYGKPNLSVIISGTFEHPTEMLLFYDHGIHKSSPATTKPTLSQVTSTIAPEDLTNTSCSVPTIMNIVAHQDDDLLFMNPDLSADIKAGRCIRTIYVTAGDAGNNSFYWLSRAQGSEAAYNNMLGQDNIWIQRTIKLASNEFVTIANPKGNTKISLLFMNLPDGNIDGGGFKSSGFTSLQKLYNKQIPSIRSVYGDSTYTDTALTNALSSLMHLYQPSEIRTQSTIAGTKYHDHSDHINVTRFVDKAYTQYEADQYNDAVTIPLQHYMGYPIHEKPVNIADGNLTSKIATFLSYAKHDGSVCQTAELCLKNQAYGAYLPREYQADQ